MSLKTWFGKGPKGDWVDIGAPKKDGRFQRCGRASSDGGKRKYPKCVPRSVAKNMTPGERKSAVQRKRSKKQGVGGKPTNVKTFAKDGGIVMAGHKGGKMATKGAMTKKPGGMMKGGPIKKKKPGGMMKGGTVKKPGGMMKGGTVKKPGGMNKGGAVKRQGVRKPSSKNVGLFG